MDESKGKFICPKCNHNNGITSKKNEFSDGNYKKWFCRKENNNGKLENKWFFYNREEYWNCCSCCEGTEYKECCSDYLTCGCSGVSGFEYIVMVIIYGLSFVVVYLIYFLIFLWIDIINYCRKPKNQTDYIVVTKTLGKNFTKLRSNEIWKYAHFESELESIDPWICLKCKHNFHSFKDFISQSYDLNRTTEIQNLKSEDLGLYGIISVLFNSDNGKLNYAITCKKTEIFSNVEKILLDKFPEYKKKKLFYVQNANVIDKQKSLEDNQIIPGFAIIVNIMDE